MPRKRDNDPTDMPARILPNLQLVDVIDGGARFRFRLVGTAVADAYGRDFTGEYPDEMFPDDRLNFIQNIYRTVCRSKSPMFVLNKYYTPKNLDLLAIRVYMPLSEDDCEVHHILGCMQFKYGMPQHIGSWGDDAQLDPLHQHTEMIEIEPPAAA